MNELIIEGISKEMYRRMYEWISRPFISSFTDGLIKPIILSFIACNWRNCGAMPFFYTSTEHSVTHIIKHQFYQIHMYHRFFKSNSADWVRLWHNWGRVLTLTQNVLPMISWREYSTSYIVFPNGLDFRLNALQDRKSLLFDIISRDLRGC